MYFTYADKKGGGLRDEWRRRRLAFDTHRRHLYYSAPLPATETADGVSTVSTGSRALREAGHRLEADHCLEREGRAEAAAAAPPLRWKQKYKVDGLEIWARQASLLPEDVGAREDGGRLVEIHGETRVLPRGGTPPGGPLLCPSTGPAGPPWERCHASSPAFLRDPFALQELYDALREGFTVLEAQRPPEEAGGGTGPRTLPSPRPASTGLFGPARGTLFLRFRTTYEMRRFVFVVQSVLGYDRLRLRPYRGLPPYDPRNGIVFGQIPFPVLATFQELEKTVFYVFLQGHLMGKNFRGEVGVLLHDVYLCITHDMVLILRASGSIPRWVRLQEVTVFAYNHTGRRPYMAFLSDPGAPDIFFLPHVSASESETPFIFTPAVEVLRVRHVMHRVCFASLDVRRVFDLREAHEPSVEAFIEGEIGRGREINFDPAPTYTGALSCPLPTEQLAAVWHEAQVFYEEQSPTAADRVAIPVYANHYNGVLEAVGQLPMLQRHLERERGRRDEIVGIPVEEARQLPLVIPVEPLAAENPARVHRRREHREPSLQALDEARLRTPQLAVSAAVFSPLGSSPRSGTNLSEGLGGVSVQSGYLAPGTRYFTQREMEVPGRSLPPVLAEDHHVVLFGQTPLTSHPDTALLGWRTEVHLDTLVSSSLQSMHAQACRGRARRSTGRETTATHIPGRDTLET